MYVRSENEFKTEITAILLSTSRAYKRFILRAMHHEKKTCLLPRPTRPSKTWRRTRRFHTFQTALLSHCIEAPICSLVLVSQRSHLHALRSLLSPSGCTRTASCARSSTRAAFWVTRKRHYFARAPLSASTLPKVAASRTRYSCTYVRVRQRAGLVSMLHAHHPP